MDKCKLCGIRDDFVKAHVVPSSFYPAIDGPRDMLLGASSKPDGRRYRTPTGIYDPKLVCAACEQRFSPWDTFAHRLLIERADLLRPEYDDSTLIAYWLPSYNYSQLKLFFLSLLWRAAATNREEFSRVKLGPFLDRLAAFVKDGNPGATDDFTVILERLEGHSAATAMLSPVRARICGLKFYRFCFAGYRANIKVDERSTPAVLREIALAHDKPLIIIAKEFKGGSEHRAMLKIAKMHFRDRKSS